MSAAGLQDVMKDRIMGTHDEVLRRNMKKHYGYELFVRGDAFVVAFHVAISGMVAQELVNGLNLIPADEVLEMGKEGALKAMEAQCTGAPDEAACAKAFEAAERAAVFASTL